jgi:hypothetical protein
MDWTKKLISRFSCGSDWRDIATAPLHREIELAIIDGDVGVLGFCGLRHTNGWLDAETLKPVTVAATHWRYRQSAVVPVSCC